MGISFLPTADISHDALEMYDNLIKLIFEKTISMI